MTEAATYYDRQATLNSDGTPLFCSDHDKQNEYELVRVGHQAQDWARVGPCGHAGC